MVTERILMRLLAMLALVTVSALAPLPGSAFANEPTWLPKPARVQGDKGDKCVADTDWMRRNHMTALNHQRDDTVHQGIRTRRFSLKGCIDCHAVKGADAKPVTIASPQHFCRTCHDYTAVRVDCFECHASRPETDALMGRGTARESEKEERAALAQYLRSVGQ